MLDVKSKDSGCGMNWLAVSVTMTLYSSSNSRPLQRLHTQHACVEFNIRMCCITRVALATTREDGCCGRSMTASTSSELRRMHCQGILSQQYCFLCSFPAVAGELASCLHQSSTHSGVSQSQVSHGRHMVLICCSRSEGPAPTCAGHYLPGTGARCMLQNCLAEVSA